MNDAHDIEMMMRTLDVTSLDYLNCLNGVKELRRRLDHPNNTHHQSLRLPLHVGEAETEGIVEFHMHYRVCF